jgi:hypothetical protein
MKDDLPQLPTSALAQPPELADVTACDYTARVMLTISQAAISRTGRLPWRFMQPKLLRSPLLTAIAVLLAVAPLTTACASPCPPDDCSPAVEIVGSPRASAFPDGEIRVAVERDGETTECVTTLPDALTQATDCDDLTVFYARATECVRMDDTDNPSIRCGQTGPWQQNIWINDAPESIGVTVTFPDGSETQNTFEPDYEVADPDRVNCSDCPRTMVAWELP